MLTEYKGAANCSEMLAHLVGEKITGVFQDSDGAIVFRLESGAGFRVGSRGAGNEDHTPAFWVVKPSEIGAEVARQRADLMRKLESLG